MILRELIRRRVPGAALAPDEMERLRRRIRESGVADRGIGLVLSGGGGKGAYQIGCWRALRELGLDRFTSIAGTSVGALNAALIAQGDFEKARSVWFGISPSHVLRFNLLTSLRSFLLRTPLIPYYSLKYVQRLRGRLTPSLWEAYYYYRDDLRKHGIWGLAQYRAVFKHLFGERRWWWDSLTWLLTMGDTDREGTTFVLPIVPSRGLGGFIKGTLNFYSGKARALMQLGYTDTIEAFQEYDMSELSPAPLSSF